MMNRKAVVLLVVISALGMIGLTTITGSFSTSWLLLIMMVCAGVFCLAFPVLLKRTKPTVWITVGLVFLIGLLVPSTLFFEQYENDPFFLLGFWSVFLWPSLALVSAAFLLYCSLADDVTRNNRLIALTLSLLLVLRVFHNLYNLTLWDNTYDPLEYLLLVLPILFILFSGLMLFIALPVKAKPVSFLFAIILPVLLAGVSTLAQRVDFRQYTLQKAKQTVRAIEAYKAREGHYPETLSKMGLWYAISHPKPMIMYGQDWCYEGGDEYYRLGYIDRDHWSSPNLIGRIYSSVGEVSDSQPICTDEFKAVQFRHPDFPYAYVEEVEKVEQ